MGELLTPHDPSAWTRTLAYRQREELPFDVGAVGAATPIMLDTAVYLDALRAPGLPGTIARLLARNVVLHCAIACAELAVSIGHLNPAHRIQGYARESRKALLNDALLLLTAIEAGATLISRNVRHTDILLRFRPDAQMLLYDRLVPKKG